MDSSLFLFVPFEVEGQWLKTPLEEVDGHGEGGRVSFIALLALEGGLPLFETERLLIIEEEELCCPFE